MIWYSKLSSPSLHTHTQKEGEQIKLAVNISFSLFCSFDIFQDFSFCFYKQRIQPSKFGPGQTKLRANFNFSYKNSHVLSGNDMCIAVAIFFLIVPTLIW
jgi:hypothetical protein